MLIQTNATSGQFPRLWYRLLFTLVALVSIFFVAPCLAQPEDDEPLPPPATIPTTKVGQQLKWVLDIVNGGDMGDPKDKFTERFLELVPADALKKSLSDLREKTFDGGKIVMHRVMPDEREDTISGVIRGEGTKRLVAVFLIVDEKTGKIAGLRFAPAGGQGGEAGDMKTMDGDLGKLPGGVSFGAYELIPKDAKDPKSEFKLRPVYEFGENKRLAIGSTFKLYVLGSLAEQAAAGTLKWDDKVAIKEAWKSLPSGVMQNEPDGKEFSISEFIDKMISISDNTAADHMLRKATRGAVEEYMGRFNEGAEQNRPFLTTQEMFTIKLNKDEGLAKRYADADEDTRRVMLAEGGDVAKGGLDITKAQAWKNPIEIDKVEWFATAPECCRVMADLHRLELKPGMEPLAKALRINPGIPFNNETWKSVAFKGGSEPGVMNLTFLLERKDSRWFALSVTWNDSEKPLAEDRLIELAQKGVAILEKDGVPKPPANPAPPPQPKAKVPGEVNDKN